MAVLVGLGVLTGALLFAADYVEDFFGTALASPRAWDAVIPVFIVAVWNAVPATLAAVLYEIRILGAMVALPLALVSPASVLYAANEVAHNPDGSFIRLAYVFVPGWPNLFAGIVCVVAMVQASRRAEAVRTAARPRT
jgi:hypothetical protein